MIVILFTPLAVIRHFAIRRYKEFMGAIITVPSIPSLVAVKAFGVVPKTVRAVDVLRHVAAFGELGKFCMKVKAHSVDSFAWVKSII